MATKTITIDLVAYERLTNVRRGNESFSRVIRRVIPPPLDVEGYLADLDAKPLSEAAARAVEAHEHDRHRPSNRTP